MALKSDVCPQVFISGASLEVVGRGRHAPPYLKILSDVAVRAIADSGLAKDEIDGLVLSSSIPQPFERKAAEVAEYLGVTPAYVAMAPYGGRPATDVFHIARSAINAGMANNVLVLSADNFGTTLGLEGAIRLYMTSFDSTYEQPFGPLSPTAFALMATRHMHDHGTTLEQLAEVAVVIRRHGLLHPDSEARGELSVESVLQDVVISSPLTRSMVSLISTGGGQGFVVSKTPTSDRSVAMMGYGESAGFMNLTQAPSGAVFEHVRRASQMALRQADVSIDDLDLIQLYDPATIVPIILLESIGFCDKGEGGAFVAEGRTSLGGAIPMNTHGGTLAFRHPGMGAGLDSVHETITQLRREAGRRQVADAELGLVHGQGSWTGNNGFLVLGIA